jgi:peptidoglycan/xylan/chitin deacetylase (PgdA/CDA1 family)
VTRPLVILMYHALYANERELQDITPEDRPYAVSTQRFAEQLQAMRDAGLPFVDPARLGEPQARDGGVLLSFDDGHASNCTHALPALARHDARAVFFITSDFVERRPGFCSWTQLREMADAGMTLGSHGRSHRFLNDLGDTEAVAELRDSRDALQDRLGRVVDQVSFPGGRYRAELLPAWRQLGYRWFHSSEIGCVSPHTASVRRRWHTAAPGDPPGHFDRHLPDHGPGRPPMAAEGTRCGHCQAVAATHRGQPALSPAV